MKGPYISGTFGNLPSPSEWDWENGRLSRGETYRVIKAFTDADGDQHPIGEEWKFTGSMFSKFDDVLTICVVLPSGDEWTFPLIWMPGRQQDVLEHYQDYMARR